MKPKFGFIVLNQESYNDDEKLSIRQGNARPNNKKAPVLGRGFY